MRLRLFRPVSMGREGRDRRRSGRTRRAGAPAATLSHGLFRRVGLPRDGGDGRGLIPEDGNFLLRVSGHD